MKNPVPFLFLFAAFSFFIGSCNKENAPEDVTIEDDAATIKSAMNDEPDLVLRGDGLFERVITKPLVRLDNCRFIVEGTIEYRRDGETFAIIDFGNGDCDAVATLTVRGVTKRISLRRIHPGGRFYKVMTEPIVRLENCDYIVSGTIEFYRFRDNSWRGTLDFGNGTCDEWATWTTENGTREISMDDWHWR